MMTAEMVLEQFGQGFDCSQIVLSQFAPRLGMEEETAKRVSACFGGGMWCGHECGAVTGALLAIGLQYGHAKAGDGAQKALCNAKLAQFRQEFLKRYPSTVCRELLGNDLSQPEGMARIQEQGLLTSFCPKLVAETIEILEGVL